ncbi:DUF3265 domain-containing protein [Vibrio campbellii]|nr:DUF3265 domain-containing protein [Vibrio campbellii]
MRSTKRLRAIRNAWHFYYALLLVFKVACGGIGIALIALMRRYAYIFEKYLR